jgi:hypothetical protein
MESMQTGTYLTFYLIKKELFIMAVTFKTREGKTFRVGREAFLKYMEIRYNAAQRKKDFRENGQAAKELILNEIAEEKAR